MRRGPSTWARTASDSSLTTSRPGPICAAFHRLRSVAYMANPSWCSATGTTNWAPARRKRLAHSTGSNADPVNPGDEVLVAEVPLWAEGVAVVLVDRRARPVHLARIPLAGVGGDAVRTPVDEDAELAVDVPVRDLIARGEGVPVGAERAFGDAGVDSPKDRGAGLLDGGGLGCHGRPSSVPPGGATMMDQTPISCEVIRSLSNCVPYLVADAMVQVTGRSHSGKPAISQPQLRFGARPRNLEPER